MSAHRCCGCAPTPTSARRWLEFGEWVVPGAVLVVLPKCPACLAAYIAIATGIGISFQTASVVRFLLASLCVVSLLVVAVRCARRLFSRDVMTI
jgi:hypothetical protein